MADILDDDHMAEEVEQILKVSSYNPINRFMIFCGSQFYPCGGMEDFLSSHYTLDQAKEALLEHALAGNSTDWAHIYDGHESKMVWTYKRYT